ncbi:hypothetical protein R83H12_00470 [Fibrobacteria bacterium R8-3-H12]
MHYCLTPQAREGITPRKAKVKVYAVGNAKPLSGKSTAAVRTLPVCPSVAKIFERG